MPTYPLLVRVQDQPDYWHDVVVATSGDALIEAQAISLSGDIVTEERDIGITTTVYPAHAINGIIIYPPRD